MQLQIPVQLPPATLTARRRRALLVTLTARLPVPM